MLPLLILGTGAITLVSAAQQFHDELLRSNLNDVARKKRSLDTADSPEFYNDLHSFKYHGGDTDRKFDRDFDEDDEEIEFLPGGKVPQEEVSLLDSEKVREKINYTIVCEFYIRPLYCIVLY